MKTKPTSEKGQIIVIFAIALTALLAFSALAIDGGMIFVDRRQSQSVADTASMAGAGAAAQYLDDNGVTWVSFSCTNPKVIAAMNIAYSAALNRATINQVQNLDNDLSDKHGIEVLCVNDGANFEKHLDVHTEVTSTVLTSFIQVVFPGPIKNTVDANTRIHVRTEYAYGRAIVSISDQCGTNDGGVVFDGTSDVHITGGGVFSNSCIDAGGNISVDVHDGGISYVGGLTENGHPSLSPNPDHASAKMPAQNIEKPVCDNSPAVNWSGAGTRGPGNYSKIKLTNGTLTLLPGLYCLTGDVDLQGGEINGDGVTFYLLKDGSHDTAMSVNGNVTAHLNAPLSGPTAGILIYMADGNNGSIGLLGNGGSSFAGLIYAPDGKIDVGGTADTETPLSYSTQLIGKYIKVHGTAQININYLSSPVATTEPSLDLLQ